MPASGSTKCTTYQKGKQFCAKLAGATKVVKNVTSFYREWHVVGSENNCQAEADRANSAVKGFEQEHIDDAAKVLQDANAKLSQVNSGFCAGNEADAIKWVMPLSTRCPRTQEAGSSYQAMANKRDSSGHSHNVNCECVNH
jgi:hypothetical protein